MGGLFLPLILEICALVYFAASDHDSMGEQTSDNK